MSGSSGWASERTVLSGSIATSLLQLSTCYNDLAAEAE
jgi:hypothetical protein